MTAIKLSRLCKLSAIARFPRTFQSRLADIPQTLQDQLTAKQLAAIIDGPMQSSYTAGMAAAQ